MMSWWQMHPSTRTLGAYTEWFWSSRHFWNWNSNLVRFLLLAIFDESVNAFYQLSNDIKFVFLRLSLLEMQTIKVMNSHCKIFALDVNIKCNAGLKFPALYFYDIIVFVSMDKRSFENYFKNQHSKSFVNKQLEFKSYLCMIFWQFDRQNVLCKTFVDNQQRWTNRHWTVGAYILASRMKKFHVIFLWLTS